MSRVSELWGRRWPATLQLSVFTCMGVEPRLCRDSLSSYPRLRDHGQDQSRHISTITLRGGRSAPIDGGISPAGWDGFGDFLGCRAPVV